MGRCRCRIDVRVRPVSRPRAGPLSSFPAIYAGHHVDDVQLSLRLAAIEHQLRIVSARLGIECPPFPSDGLATHPGASADPWPSIEGVQSTQSQLPADVVELARSGHKIEAIKRLRALTGASLLEAKRAVDALDE
jgi:ribosomal protein L7/L12